MEQYTLKFIPPNRYPSACLITIYRRSGIVVATDTDEGMSVTNACELIASEVVKRYNLDAQKMIYIEQYRPGRPDQTTELVKFDFVDGKGFRHPNWNHIPAEVFKTMISIAEEVEEI
ncbi:hypothetical protein [Salmonirosea aquatica]|uniref:Uncharacterized protein n=1 Tax=Salmonirosea aquatica TaxID=2654236 RepID=A0A7C9FMM0_9BACT|nr:hypothetical protein [Cytophagaceae bacterium SJW1-29]